jgi:circadian clock protein KaiB
MARNDNNKIILELFVAGATLQSARAIENVKKICDEHLHGRFELCVIDIYQHPELARLEQIIAVPTLVKKQPAPIKRFIGALSDAEKILANIG